jgi:PAS domain S-box-containing protein
MRAHHGTSKSLIIAALVLAALVVGAAATSFLHKIESFQTVGLSAEARAGHWLVLTVDEADTGLQPQDQILLVNGETAAGLADLGEVLAAKPESALLVLRGEELTEVSYSRPPTRVDLPYLVLSAIGLVYLLIGFYTFWKDQRRPAVLFYLWCLTSAVVYLVSPTNLADSAGRALFLFEEVARLYLAPLTLHLFLIFPSTLLKARAARRLVPFLYLPATALLVLQADLMLFGGSLISGAELAATIRALDQLELFLLVSFALAALCVLVWRLAAHTEWDQRRQMVWIAVGMAGGYLPFLALYVAPRALSIDPPPVVTLAAVVPLGLVPLTFAYAILRYKLWDISVIVRDTISLTLTLLIGVFGFSLANLVIGELATGASTVARNMLTFTAGLAIAGLLVPTRRGIQTSLTRLQYGKQYQRRRALAEFGRELLRETDLGEVCNSLLERLEETVDLDRVNLLLVHGDLLQPVRADDGLPHAVSSESIDDRLWNAEVSSLSGIGLPSEEMPLEQRLFGLDYRYLLPLKMRERRVGFLISSYKSDGSPLTSDDLDLMRNLLQQTTLAIENAKLFNQVQHQLDEVSRLQRFSESIIESSPAGIAVYDGGGRVLTANAAFARLIGCDLGSLPGRPIDAVLRGTTLPQPHEGILETHFATEDGQRYLQLSTADLPQEDGSLHRLLVAQDVSERIEMENALKEKDRLASLGMLAAGVAHEVNTPITGISSYAQMMLQDTDEADPRYELLKKVERQTFRASRIVNNLLDFSREQSDERRPVDLAPLAREALDLLKERRLDSRVTLAAIELEEGALVEGSEGELQQVLTNLLVNALDAMAPMGGELRVSLSADDRWVWLTVGDTGPGIPTEQLERIFQPFFSTKLGKGGTGLGLSISYNIVRRYGGELRVASHEGEGTEFIVELPRLHQKAGSDA